MSGNEPEFKYESAIFSGQFDWANEPEVIANQIVEQEQEIRSLANQIAQDILAEADGDIVMASRIVQLVSTILTDNTRPYDDTWANYKLGFFPGEFSFRDNDRWWMKGSS